MPPTIASGNLVVIRLKKNRYNPYVLKILLRQSFRKNIFRGLQTGTSVNVINPGSLEGLMIPKVNIQDQAELAQRIIENEKAFREAIRKAEQQREILYKTYIRVGDNDSLGSKLYGNLEE